MRKHTVVALVLALAIGMTGCAAADLDEPVDPWVVANHDEKVAFHEGAGEELLNLDATAGLATLDEFQAVGYHHFSSDRIELHMEYETSVDGESYVSRLLSDTDGLAFDQSHEAGSSETYYLLGDAIKDDLADGNSWVRLPVADLGRQTDPEAACLLSSVAYTCALVDAWNITREEIDAMPVKLSHSETGNQHFSTAISYGSLVDTGLMPSATELASFASLRDTLIPMHLWVDPDGVVTKIEVNGIVTNDLGEELSLQIGFEITSREASADMVPVVGSDVPEDDVYVVTNETELREFLDKLGQV